MSDVDAVFFDGKFVPVDTADVGVSELEMLVMMCLFYISCPGSVVNKT